MNLIQKVKYTQKYLMRSHYTPNLTTKRDTEKRAWEDMTSREASMEKVTELSLENTYTIALKGWGRVYYTKTAKL